MTLHKRHLNTIKFWNVNQTNTHRVKSLCLSVSDVVILLCYRCASLFQNATSSCACTMAKSTKMTQNGKKTIENSRSRTKSKINRGQTCIEIKIQMILCTTFNVLSNDAIQLLPKIRHDRKRDNDTRSWLIKHIRDTFCEPRFPLNRWKLRCGMFVIYWFSFSAQLRLILWRSSLDDQISLQA